MSKATELIDRANTDVRIEDVLNTFYGYSIPYGMSKAKDVCPLGHEHSDGGVKKSFVVFADSNTAWCFSHRETFTPVKLWQLRTSYSPYYAAKDLLETYGMRVTPLTMSERWNKLDKEKLEPIDRDGLRSLVIHKVKGLPNYSERQYDPSVVKFVSDLLRTIDYLPDSASYDMLKEWRNKAYKAMHLFWNNHVVRTDEE